MRDFSLGFYIHAVFLTDKDKIYYRQVVINNISLLGKFSMNDWKACIILHQMDFEIQFSWLWNRIKYEHLILKSNFTNNFTSNFYINLINDFISNFTITFNINFTSSKWMASAAQITWLTFTRTLMRTRGHQMRGSNSSYHLNNTMPHWPIINSCSRCSTIVTTKTFREIISKSL